MVLKIRRGILGALRWKTIQNSSTRIKVVSVIVFLAAALLSIGVARISTVNAATCPCHVFNFDPTPNTFNDPPSIEVGFKFKSNIAGYISGIRFYKTVGMTGTHTASLWNNIGQRIAQATFSSESTAGWQEVNFAPVAITANTIYTASVFMANGYYSATTNYFTSDIISDPLVAPRDTTANDGLGFSKQGVYNVGATSVYPTNSYNAGNYWVDVTYTGALNSDPPVITETFPTANQTSVLPGSSVTATFDQVLDQATVTSSTVFVKDDTGTTVPGTLGYSSLTKKVTFTSDTPLQLGKTYTATIKGGTGTVVKSLDGVALAADRVWSFTVASTDPCPCTIKDKAGPEGSITANEGIPVELGLKVAPQANGYISKIRFYKPLTSPDTTHIGNIWDYQGNKLASVTFTNETEYGWQEAKLATPLRVTQGNIYIVSYGTSGVYQYTTGGMASTLGNDNIKAYATGDLRNAALNSGNTNGVYAASSNVYPGSGNSSGTYYWIDAVFSTDSTPADPLQVENTQPKDKSYGVRVDQKKLITFNKHLNASSVTSANVKVTKKDGSTVTVTPSYNSVKHQISLLPSGGAWVSDETYTVTLTTDLQGSDGSTLTSNYSTKFSTGSGEATAIDNGLGGPLLVITSSANAYDNYYAEILRTEGITYFDVKDITTVDATTLADYKAAILAEMPLNQSQVNMLTGWVTDGGNLVAMRPDKKLASLLGITDASSVRTNQYLKVDTASAPGAGIVSDSIQFKGSADNYTNNSAHVIASFYSDASTSTLNPAATSKSVGSKGGQAMAFTYDLARSVIMLHQGNQAWAGSDRDGDSIRRGNDLFYGNKTGDVQQDWVDLNKMHIPQADEQQRLLVNMLTESTKDYLPMPRFWYLPHDNKAAVVFAGDDHEVGAASGSEVHLNEWLNESKKNCGLLDWECTRATHYIYPDTSISNSRAVQFQQLGFEIGDHPANGGCNNFTSLSQATTSLSSSLLQFRTKFPGLPNQSTNRFHCYIWDDWDRIANASIANGIHYSLDYVAFPPAWVNGRSPVMTGSGMNMRLTDTTGATLDIHQGVTNFDNTSANATSVNALLDNAIGSSGFYGMYGTHYDMSDSYDTTILNAAKSRNIPLISSQEALEWLDGRGDSQFEDLTSSSKGKVAFSVRPGQGAVGLRAMMPINDADGTLSKLESDGQDVSYTTKTIKGVDYAVFDAVPGEYAVTYSDYDPNPPTTPTEPTPTPSGQTDDTANNGSTTSQTPQKGGVKSHASTSGKTSDENTTSDEAEGVIGEPDKMAPDVNNDQGADGPKDQDKKNEQKTEENGLPWWVWTIGSLPIVAGASWFVLTRFRHGLK